MEFLKKLRVFNGNGLKLLAAAFMLVDHMGMMLFPDLLWMRIIGRFSMPLFAFMIAEGCRYTKNKVKHFSLLFGLGALCQIVYIVFDPTTIYLGILITFSLSTLIIYAMQYAKKCTFEEETKTDKKILAWGLVLLLVALSYLLTRLVAVDYGFWGIMMPVFASVFDFHRIPAPDHWKKLDYLPIKVLCMLVAEVLLVLTCQSPLFLPLSGGFFIDPHIQSIALCAFPLLLLYNGEKGKANLKYFFYIFYPLHLGVLQGIVFLLYLLA